MAQTGYSQTSNYKLPVANGDPPVYANQAEAEAAVVDEKAMSPLKTKQQINARLADEPTAVAGTDSFDLMTALRVTQLLVARIADQAASEAGNDNTVLMTPEGTQQFLDVRLADQAEAEAGTDAEKLMTVLRTAQQITARLAEEAAAVLGLEADTLISPVTLKAAAVKGDYKEDLAALTRSIEARLKEEFSVRSFVGDVNDTDGTQPDMAPAIQDAMDTLAGKSIVSVPSAWAGGQLQLTGPGVYRTDTEVIIKKDTMSMRGLNQTTPLLRSRANGTTIPWHDMQVVRSDTLTAGKQSFVEAPSHHFMQLGAVNTANGNRGFVYERVSRGVIEYTTTRNLHIGYMLKSCARVHLERPMVANNNRSRRAWAGVMVTNTTDIQDDTTGCRIEGFELDSNPLDQATELANYPYSCKYPILIEASDGCYIVGGHGKGEYGIACVVGGVRWEVDVYYEVGDIPIYSVDNKRYFCTFAHLSTDFVVELGLGYWIELEGGIYYDPESQDGPELSGINITSYYSDKFCRVNLYIGGAGAKIGTFQIVNSVFTTARENAVKFDVDPANEALINNYVHIGGVIRGARRAAVWDKTGKLNNAVFSGILLDNFNTDHVGVGTQLVAPDTDSGAAFDIKGSANLYNITFEGGHESAPCIYARAGSRINVLGCNFSKRVSGVPVVVAELGAEVYMPKASNTF